MNKFLIKHNSPQIDRSDLESLKRVFNNNNILTNGPILNQFENTVKSFINVKYAIACSSGTAALHLALLTIGLKKNDTVIMPGINFISSFNVCKNMGLKIYFADVDKNTGQMKPEHVLSCISKNKINRVKAIITMYMGGFPENILEFYKLKKKLKCYLIEDACHAFGAEYNYNKKYFKIGSCKHSDICTFSFHPLKTITTGEGGLVSTNNRNFSRKIKLLRSHGIVKKKKYWDYDVILNGFNYRMSEFNASIGLSQIKKVKKFLKIRERNHKILKVLLGNNSISFPNYNNLNKSANHLFLASIRFKNKRYKDSFFKKLNEKRVEIHYHYNPIYKFSIYKNKNLKLKGCENYLNETFSLPLHSELSIKKIKYVVKNIKNWIYENSNFIR